MPFVKEMRHKNLFLRWIVLMAACLLLVSCGGKANQEEKVNIPVVTPAPTASLTVTDKEAESSSEDSFWDSSEDGEDWSQYLPSGESGESSIEDTLPDSSEDSVKPSTGDLNDPSGPGATLDQYGSYTSMEDVALYLETYEELPDNFITKKEAEALGWSGGSLEPYAPGKCIGGDKFGNYEKLLPTKKGRVYYECDIDTLGAKKRGAKRIIYSNDGLIYYTSDHYESFTLLYGDE